MAWGLLDSAFSLCKPLVAVGSHCLCILQAECKLWSETEQNSPIMVGVRVIEGAYLGFRQLEEIAFCAAVAMGIKGEGNLTLHFIGLSST